LQDAVKYRGSSLADEQYVDLFGQPGEFQHYHQVYDKEGAPCQRCRRPLRRARFSNRSTFFCEACQV
jgi:formamidopyrimidine-DNA glycosylase